jgi:hypothetical protein
MKVTATLWVLPSEVAAIEIVTDKIRHTKKVFLFLKGNSRDRDIEVDLESTTTEFSDFLTSRGFSPEIINGLYNR